MGDFCAGSRGVAQFRRQATWRKMSAVLVRGGGRSTPQFSLRLLEIFDLRTVLWYTQDRSEK